MTCHPILSPRMGKKTMPDGTVRITRKVTGYYCTHDSHRLRLPLGGYVYMDWHHYCGPTFFHDRAGNREIENWWEDEEICAALEWFEKRGCVS